MFTKADFRQIILRSLLTIALLATLIGVGLLINVGAAKRSVNEFEMANDFPRGALVYAQFSDLPAMLRQWDDSKLKSRYLACTSFQQLQTRHLGLKLVSRWKELNDATGFSIDDGVLAGLADNRAAIAVYDIGRLDLVMIAPLSEEKIAACAFLQRKNHFEEATLADGTVYYLHDVEADKGRQKQQIGFAALKGRFVLATNEKLLLRAIANLNGQAGKDRLTDEPSFQTLSKAIQPHFATVWVDHSKLNDDWYFKRYWLMSNVADLKHIQAGIFDLEMQRDKWVERREFLSVGNQLKTEAAISGQTLQLIAAIVPFDIPFMQMRAADDSTPALVADAHESPIAEGTRGWCWDHCDVSDFEVSPEEEEYEGHSRYSHLSHKYNQFVNDPDDAGERGADDIPASRTVANRKTIEA